MRRPSRSPQLEELLRLVVAQGAANLHVSMPGRIETYDNATQKATVTPLLQTRTVALDGEEILDTLPKLQDVPVVFQRAGDFFMSFPLKKGDHVLLVFQDRSIDQWATTAGGVTDPVDFRTHDLSDAVAIPGLYPFEKALSDALDDRLALGVDEGMQLRFESEEAEFFRDGFNKLSVAIAEKLEALYTNVKAAFDSHNHATGVGPSGPPMPQPTFPAWDSDINSNKVKLPEN